MTLRSRHCRQGDFCGRNKINTAGFWERKHACFQPPQFWHLKCRISSIFLVQSQTLKRIKQTDFHINIKETMPSEIQRKPAVLFLFSTNPQIQPRKGILIRTLYRDIEVPSTSRCWFTGLGRNGLSSWAPRGTAKRGWPAMEALIIFEIRAHWWNLTQWDACGFAKHLQEF